MSGGERRGREAVLREVGVEGEGWRGIERDGEGWIELIRWDGAKNWVGSCNETGGRREVKGGCDKEKEGERRGGWEEGKEEVEEGNKRKKDT